MKEKKQREESLKEREREKERKGCWLCFATQHSYEELRHHQFEGMCLTKIKDL